jgi:hypothetical protein
MTDEGPESKEKAERFKSIISSFRLALVDLALH